MQIQTIKFHEDNLLAVEHNGQHYIAMKPIVESMGLQWHAQFERLKRNSILNSTIRMIRTVAEDGKSREMLMLDIDYLNGWLFGIEANRIKKEDVKQKVNQYQKECYKVLNDYFKKGVAVNENFKDTQAQIETLNSKVEDLQNKLSLATDFLTPKMKNHVKQMVKAKIKKEPLLTFQGVYSQLNDKFKVAKYDEIPRDKYLDVCDFFEFKPLDEYRPKSQEEFLDNLPKWLRCSLKPTNDVLLVYNSTVYRVDEDIRVFSEFK